MTNKRWLYWALQFLGWGAVFSLGLLGEYFSKGKVEVNTAFKALTILVFVVLITNLYRLIILKLKWLNKPVVRVIPRALTGSIFLAICIISFNILLSYFTKDDFAWDIELFKKFLGGTLSYFILVSIWTIIYFSYHYFDKSRVQEVKNLQLESSQKESELSNLKNQLNPHFMFNAMNSIRALVDEDPILAKKSITQLSNLLRNTLLQGKKRLITVTDEVMIVNDYLALEKIRFEERLEFKADVKPITQKAFLPPLIIQTLVENAIKHGISKKAVGGLVAVYISKVEDNICIEVHNDGEYIKSEKPDVGIGLQNARKRLSILYGDNASISIGNYNNKVISKIILPFQTELTKRQ
jgi:sensor histidine kinase YesM